MSFSPDPGRSAAEQPWTVPAQHGRRYLVTGASSGLGAELSRRLALAGAEVVMAVRNQDKGERVRQQLLDAQPDARLELQLLDLADLGSIASFAERWQGRPLDVLVNNAGIMVPPQRSTTVDGFDIQLGTNYLGPVALTNRLLPNLLAGDRPRVAFTGSIAASFGRIDFADLQWQRRRYVSFLAYAQSKLADLLAGVHLARVSEQHAWPLLVTTSHPGFTRTGLMSDQKVGRRTVPELHLPDWFRQEVAAGAEPMLRAIADPDARNGDHFGPSSLFGLVGSARRVRLPRGARSAELAANLWTVAEQLTSTSLAKR